MQTRTSLETLVGYYENCLERHGDTCQGVGWPNDGSTQKRYQVMYDVMKGSSKYHILDYGCGLGHYRDFLRNEDDIDYNYTGYDPSSLMIAKCKQKYPDGKFTDSFGLIAASQYDYVIMNGLFTVRQGLTGVEAAELMDATLRKVLPLAKVGVAFNVMAAHSDPAREDLFHAPIDSVVAWLRSYGITRIVVRQDYGLYEYTVYAYIGEGGL